MIMRACLLLVALTSPLRAQEFEYHGEFLDPLDGVFITVPGNRPHFKLNVQFRFQDPNGFLWTVPGLTVVDGASIPEPLWSVIGAPFTDNYLNASVIHDYYCEAKSRTAHDTHRAFYYGMKAANVPEWRAKLMYWAVATFGPDWVITQSTQPVAVASCDPNCTEPSGALTSSSQNAWAQTSPKYDTAIWNTEWNTDAGEIDWNDPEVRAAAISKTEAVARTLFTSNGLLVDSSSSGIVTATLDDIDNNARGYKRLLASKEFKRNPDRLGILSHVQNSPQGIGLLWSGGVVPAFTTTPALQALKAESVLQGEAFRVNLDSRLSALSVKSGTNL